MKNKLQPTRTSFSRNFQCKKAPHWLSKFFSFWYWKSGGPVKKTTLYIVYYIVYSSKHLHKKMYTRWQPGTFKIKVVKDWSLSTSPCNIFWIIGDTYLERKKGHGQSLVHYFLHLSCQQTGSWQWEYFIFNKNSFPSKAHLKTNSSAFMFQHLFLNITHMTVPIYYIVDS